MVPASVQLADGTTHTYRDYDPDYAPRMPHGAVRGDVRKQEFCRMCHVPRYFYVDQERRCVQCGLSFLFEASEQKYWHETLKFHFDSVAIRCKECRRKRRSEKALHRQLAATLASLRESPEDAAQLIALAETTLQLWDRTRTGNLERALSAARKAEKLMPKYAPAVFFQARCHESAGREKAALDVFSKFCTLPSAARHRAMWRHAQSKLPPGPDE